jgi:hypothetical protein
LIYSLLSIVLLSGGAAWAGTPDPSDQPAASASPATTAGPPGQAPPSSETEDAIPDDLFTSVADPLTLSLSKAKRGVSKLIGTEGGTINVKGRDGTRYSLSIPEQALPMSMRITMVPITGVTGFPDGTVPERTLGVELTPSGLELAHPATLRIRPRKAPPTIDMAVLSTGSGGEEAGFHHFVEQKGVVALEIDHFSSYFQAWPLTISTARLIARQQLTRLEERYAKVLASYLAIIRQEELRGRQPFYTREYVINAITEKYLRDVLYPRLAAAGQGCAEAEDAVTALIQYGRQMALNGYADIPIVDMVEDSGWVTRDLIRTLQTLCFKEAYEVCVETGHFPGLVLHYYEIFSRGKEFLGYEPEADMVALAVDYIRRCGRFRFKLATSFAQDDSQDIFEDAIETTREFHLQWEPGDLGGWGLFGSRIRGTGDVEVQKLDVLNICPSRVSNIRNPTQAEAEITSLLFDRNDLNVADPVELIGLDMTINFGKVAYTVTRRRGCADQYEASETFSRHAGLIDLVVDQEDFDRWTDEVAAEAVVWSVPLKRRKGTRGGWEFRRGRPMRAILALDREERLKGPGGEHRLLTRVEIIVEHDPQ